jgi:ferredoxin
MSTYLDPGPAGANTMKIYVDPALCQGHNRCVAVAPTLFGLDDEGYATAVGGGVVAVRLTENARLAEANCPEQAVVVTGDA